MKEFISKFLIIVSVIVIVIASCCFIIPHDKNDYLAEFAPKIQLLKKTESPRVVFIGGSNIAFGLDSERIKDSLKVDVVNMGLHAGLGIRFTLSQCVPYIREGDIVVMDVEYINFFDGSDGEPGTLADLIVSNKGLGFSAMSPRQKIISLSGIPKVGRDNLSKLLHYPKNKTFDTPIPKDGGRFAYCKSGFNRYGDEISHWHLKTGGAPRLNDPVSGWRYDKELGKWYFDKLTSISKKATVIVMPPALAQTSFTVQENYINQLAEIFRSEGFPYVVNPQSMSIPDEDMYDTNYHCAKTGVDLNTGRIIYILKPLLNRQF